MRGRSRSAGFTIIELMITLAVLAIILTIGIPSFRTLIENNRVTSQANTLLSAVNLARTEAIKRGTEVTLLAEAGGFANGYCVTVGNYANCGAAEAGNDVIRSFEEPGALILRDGGLTNVSFDGRGFRSAPGAGVNVQIEFQPLSCTLGDQRLRQLNVARAGRASVTQGNCT
ncbi:type IV fimbrial biogenesis protein FimT [Marinobacter segnicrescens]|uniref:Type II secretion system protein H n=1 Tax=Marinobacter segnicrescens TaxID=430453 RepID=A0A1I0GR30_9GAMM|nr:GspH/FimT family pseudopilin [Marinobacter segnicrescens]SET73573.1 type IV fimbrial biogenesis protein FimT [Marinobacter segnicrescens]